MDEKPVTVEERRLNNAWGADGRDGENLERKKINDEKKEETEVIIINIIFYSKIKFIHKYLNKNKYPIIFFIIYIKNKVNFII